jgi:hypothetical protein
MNFVFLFIYFILRSLAAKVGCNPEASSKELVECLRKVIRSLFADFLKLHFTKILSFLSKPMKHFLMHLTLLKLLQNCYLAMFSFHSKVLSSSPNFRIVPKVNKSSKLAFWHLVLRQHLNTFLYYLRVIIIVGI